MYHVLETIQVTVDTEMTKAHSHKNLKSGGRKTKTTKQVN